MDFVILFSILGSGMLVYLQVSHRRRVKYERGLLFDEVKHIFSNVQLVQEGINYPKLTGTYQDYPLKLEPVVDTLAFRKLPVLWLFITQYRSLKVKAPIDILLRPNGTEFFSPNSNFCQEITPPKEGWPKHIRVASPDLDQAPSLEKFQPLTQFLNDPSTKEILVTSKGIRIVWRIAEGNPIYYQVTRRAKINEVKLSVNQLIPILETLSKLGDALTEQCEA
ncbi:hypothetical protein [Rubrobacter xylanophilus]|nr:hypothetical protein [Rubrobacter xylanophilus]